MRPRTRPSTARRRKGTELLPAGAGGGHVSTCAVKSSLLSSLYVAVASFPTDGEVCGGVDFYNLSVVRKVKPCHPVACIGAKNKSAIGVQGAVC